MKLKVWRGSRTVEIEARGKLTEVKSAERNTYGWQGGHGVALTVTAHCSACERRVTVQYHKPGGGLLKIFHRSDRNGDHVAEPEIVDLKSTMKKEVTDAV